jgi:hypothetical protein
VESTKRWLSAEEVAKQVKVSAMTIKRNCQTYKEFVDVKKGEKNKYLINEECVPVFHFIAKMRNKRNLQSGQIVELLEKEGFPRFIDTPVIETSKRVSEQLQFSQGFVPVQEVEKLVSDRVAEEIQKHEEVLKKLFIEQQKQQQEFQKVLIQKLEERDQKLLYAVREIQESRKEAVAAIQQQEVQPKKKWWQFWR